jgi:hypothetical protein
MNHRPPKLIEIRSEDEIPPAFASEAEEAEFWDTHSFSDDLLQKMVIPVPDWFPPPRPRTSPVSIRFDADTLARLKALAKARHKGYQTLLKEFVVERLYEEEKRAGVIGPSR